MPEKPQWWSKIPTWVPVGALVVAAILAHGEQRWTLQNHINKDAVREAEDEKLQWKAIGELNRLTYKAEEILKFHDHRIKTLEDR